MTPTLLGRWQTRIWLLATVGLLVTFFFASWFETVQPGAFGTPFVVLFWVAAFGLAWDALFDRVQRKRWDSDWPPAYQLGAGVIEGFVLFVLIRLGLVPGVPEALPAWMFLDHYIVVWIVTFLMTQGPMRILFPQQRFRGGQFGRHPLVKEER